MTYLEFVSVKCAMIFPTTSFNKNILREYPIFKEDISIKCVLSADIKGLPNVNKFLAPRYNSQNLIVKMKLPQQWVSHDLVHLNQQKFSTTTKQTTNFLHLIMFIKCDNSD